MSENTKEEFERLMKLLGWTQAEAARQLGVVPSAVANMVAGKSPPSLQSIRMMRLIWEVNQKEPKLGGAFAAKDAASEYTSLTPPDKMEYFVSSLVGLDRDTRDALLTHFASLARCYPRRMV